MGWGLLIAKLLKLLWRLDKTLNKAMWLLHVRQYSGNYPWNIHEAG
jgi:hypothetical protein